jgi:hypothetical protein
MTSRTSPSHRSWRATLLRRAWVTGLALATTALSVTSAGAATGGPSGVLPPLPDGLNVAVGKHVAANSPSAPASSPALATDGDGSTRWCPGTVGAHTLTVDLGKAIDITGTGVTFSGEEGNDGSHYTVTTGLTPQGGIPFPHQAAADRNAIVQGPLYLFAGSGSDVSATVRARYVTLHFQVPREQSMSRSSGSSPTPPHPCPASSSGTTSRR